MRLLESAPRRYDAGMRLLTFGAMPAVQAHAAETAMAAGRRVLEIGCGTGAVTARMLEHGARVDAVDQNPEMMDQARRRLEEEHRGSLRLIESSASEIDSLKAEAYDAVVASFSLSEMSDDERAYVLAQTVRLLRPGGSAVVADEVRPAKPWQRIVHALLRFPLALLTWLVTGRTSRPLADPEAELLSVGLVCARRWPAALGSMAVVSAAKPL